MLYNGVRSPESDGGNISFLHSFLIEYKLHFITLIFFLLPPFKAYFDYKEDAAFPKPPSYNVATSLPSYDEAERSKTETFVPLVTGRVSIAPLSNLSAPNTYRNMP